MILRGGSGCGYWSKSLFREFVTFLYDVQMKTLITLLLACCFGSAVAQSNLPACPIDTEVTWNNCYGTITYASGAKFVGEWKDSKRNGQGTYTWASGDKYVGEFKDNLRNGQGTLTYPDGFKYIGEVNNGTHNGHGIG